MKLKVSVEYETECKTIEEAQEELSNRFARENTTASVEFWENMRLYQDRCEGEDCGVSLNLDEEKEDGKCVSCAGRPGVE